MLSCNQRVTINTVTRIMNEPFGYIDCHSHILPGIDDGAQDLFESICMLQSLQSQGVNTVWLTPHFYPYKESIDSFLDKRGRSYTTLKPYGDELGVNLIPASETYLSDCLFNIPNISELCVDGQKYLLTELPHLSEYSYIFARINRLIATYSVIPILAHVERYKKLFRNIACLDELIDMGCLIQTNLSALENGIFHRKRLIQYIDGNVVHIIGTDCHNMKSRPPKYLNGISVIEKKLGADAVGQLMENAMCCAAKEKEVVV